MQPSASVRAQDMRVLRTGVAVSVVLLALASGLGAAVSGADAALGGAVGVLLVAVFFSVSLVAVAAAGRVSPQAMFQTAITTYMIKIPAVLALLAVIRHVSSLHPVAFGWSVIGATLVWLLVDVRLFMTSRQLYVEPEVTA